VGADGSRGEERSYKAIEGAFALLGLVLLHVGAALYHQLVRRDRLLARMGIGRVAGEPRGAAQFDLDIPDMTPGERM